MQWGKYLNHSGATVVSARKPEAPPFIQEQFRKKETHCPSHFESQFQLYHDYLSQSKHTAVLQVLTHSHHTFLSSYTTPITTTFTNKLPILINLSPGPPTSNPSDQNPQTPFCNPPKPKCQPQIPAANPPSQSRLRNRPGTKSTAKPTPPRVTRTPRRSATRRKTRTSCRLTLLTCLIARPTRRSVRRGGERGFNLPFPELG